MKKTKKKPVVVGTVGDRKNLNPLAASFMDFASKELGWEFVDVKGYMVVKGGKKDKKVKGDK